ncbi:(E)-4-hydroxy-3-methylbut-2-enyl-diphosphate synthase [Pedobacter caeni]|uniref:4-hydroxy-3-methylbut-2-en-1-yl diphosphate synthase (flavodoxin) n=1 Tax=Pedobacter caeni TaxID=288992 RepID=A0A1M5HXK3_9SPHI|nr:(E)-4-hydroxy-3-methylbut-2-enyl-diphosphate synthase [Pedobacter caeni]SHG20602.1 4-hydroxy-3-methylbut-2-en-1-yl diphosphate synthase [Pedobacter caeni]
MQSEVLSLDARPSNRLTTVDVKAGNLLLGSSFPIRLQTMTTTDTMDTIATVDQVMKCVDAGADLVRITAPGLRDAENLLNIQQSLRKNGCFVPLVADIHFTPNAAEAAARIVEKVRINPGNYADKKKFESIDYNDDAYQYELDRIRSRFVPLIKICKEYGTALRIGTNHGSLSDRIMSRYGDSPIGMVESAMEFLRIAEDLNFYNIVLSMKSSNPLVMIGAYHLLVENMQQELKHCYPLHLGVTEAGDTEQGRIKSAIGIGTLLESGIGDTIRVSLTEAPEFELPVCRSIVQRYSPRSGSATRSPEEKLNHSFRQDRVSTAKILNIGADRPPIVVADFSGIEEISSADFAAIGYGYNELTDKWNIGHAAADYIFLDRPLSFSPPGMMGMILPFQVWRTLPDKETYFPLFELDEYKSSRYTSGKANMILLNYLEIGSFIAEFEGQDLSKVVLVIDTAGLSPAKDCIKQLHLLEISKLQVPCILRAYPDDRSMDDLIVNYAAYAGELILNGWKDGIWLVPPVSNEFDHLPLVLNNIAFGILQVTRARISGTEYISCPSCGRTLFDLQTTTEKVRLATNHLKGLKIAIMGCIVNGPGEMADADFGYVGSGPGRISLYRGKDMIRRNVASEVAVDMLIDLIKEYEMWEEPP